MGRKAKKEYALERNYPAVGQYLRECRLRAGLTQKEAADVLEYTSPQHISNFEAGIAVPSIKNLAVLRELYDMDVDRFLGLFTKAERQLSGGKGLKKRARLSVRELSGR